METIDINEIASILPHRYPFLLIDRVVSFTPGEKIVGYKNVTINEPFFQGHFPGQPVFPGVLILEGMAQAGGVLLMREMEPEERRRKLVYFAAMERARFRRPVVPGIRSSRTRRRPPPGEMRCARPGR